MSLHAKAPAAHGTEIPTDESTEEIPKDDIFHILQTQRRRDALRYLKDHDNPVEMRDMAEQVAAWENDTTVQALTSAQRQRVYIALYQSHLPKLDREGVIDYNQSRGIVRREPLASQFDPYLDETAVDDAGSDVDADADAEPEPDAESRAPAAESSDDRVGDEPRADGQELAAQGDASRWITYYHATTLVGALAIGASVLGLPLVASLPDVLLGTAIIAAFALISIAQTLDVHRLS